MTVGESPATIVANKEPRPPSASGRFTIIDEQFKETTDDSFDESESDEFPETHLSKSASGCSLSIRFSRTRNFSDSRGCSSLTKCQSTALQRELFKNSASASNLQLLFANQTYTTFRTTTMHVTERFKVKPFPNSYTVGRWECRDSYDNGRTASIPETAELQAPMIGEMPKSGSLPPLKRSVVFRVDSTRSDFFTPHANGLKESAHYSAIPTAIVTPPSVTNALTAAISTVTAPASHSIVATPLTHGLQPKPQAPTVTYHTPAHAQAQPESSKSTLPPPNRPVVFGISAANSPGSSLDRMEHYYNLRGKPAPLHSLLPHSPVCYTPSSASSLRVEEEPNRFTFDERATAMHNEELQTEIRNQLAYLVQQKQQKQHNQQLQLQAYRQTNSPTGHSRPNFSSLRDLLSNYPTSAGPGAITATPQGIIQKIGSLTNVHVPPSPQPQYRQLHELHDAANSLNRQPLNYYDLERSLHATTMAVTLATNSAVRYMRSPSSPLMSRGASVTDYAPPKLTVMQHAPPLRARNYSDSRATIDYYRCNSRASETSECDSECDSDIFDIQHQKAQLQLQQHQQLYGIPSHERHGTFQQFGHHLLQPHQNMSNRRLTPFMKMTSHMGSSASLAAASSLAANPKLGDNGIGALSAMPTSHIAIDSKIEQAMDLVKTHLMFAVREEVKLLRSKIVELESAVIHLEAENSILREHVPQTVLQGLQPIGASGLSVGASDSSHGGGADAALFGSAMISLGQPNMAHPQIAQ